MRKKVVIGNWKMNMTAEEAKNFLRFMSVEVKDNEVEVGFAVPYTALWSSIDAVKDNEYIGIAAQNVHFEPRGAYTGEISVEMLKEAGVKYCIIGHSERRRYNEESNETMKIKFNNCYENNIIPIYCIGANIEHEIDVAFNSVHDDIIFAYEPIENIGNKNPNLDFVEKRMEYIKEYISYKYH